MSIKYKKMKTGPVEIDLTGPDGNAFVLIGTASKLAKQLGLDGKKIQDEMKSFHDFNAWSATDWHFSFPISAESNLRNAAFSAGEFAALVSEVGQQAYNA